MNALAPCRLPWQQPLRLYAWMVIGLPALVACQPADETPSVAEEVVPPPAFVAQVGIVVPEEVPRAEFIAYARGLTYDTADGTGDEQRLAVPDTIVRPPDTLFYRHGPLVRIEPAVGTHRLSLDSLAAGRVIARLVNRSDDEGHPELALGAADTTYWWVDSVQTGRWRSVLVSTDTSILLVTDTLTFTEHDEPWPLSFARFRWANSPEGLWMTCPNGRCCVKPG